MEQESGLIGFGEAGRTFALAGDWSCAARVFDIKTGLAQHRAAMQADYDRAGVTGCASLGELVRDATLLLSLVTADQALAVAQSAAAHIAPGALYCDMNSIAPQTKQAAAALIDAAGGHYVDVAIMAPVHRARLAAPLLLSGVHAEAAMARLAALGFTYMRIVGDAIGRASSTKMIRSVVVKGLEALTAECVLAAEAAGVRDDVLASLDASETSKPWAERADYVLDRMMIHGLRRAAEMEEVVKTLDNLGTGSAMTRGTVERQRAIGTLGLTARAKGLSAKIRQMDKMRMQGA